MPTDPTVAAGVLNLLSTNVTGSSCLDTLDGISAELANDIHFRFVSYHGNISRTDQTTVR